MDKKPIYSPLAPDPIGPYSQAILVQGQLFISGQIAFEESQKGSIKNETRQVMKQLEAILKEAEMNFGNVVKCGIFLKDMNDFGVVNEVYGSFFNEVPPARETVQVAMLPKNVNVEISAIAIKK